MAAAAARVTLVYRRCQYSVAKPDTAGGYELIEIASSEFKPARTTGVSRE
jgi:hypothetical protein